MQVTVQPDVLPSGVEVETIAPNPDNPSGATGIELGGTFYPATWDFGGAGGIQLMILDRATLAVVEQDGDPTRTFHPSDQGATALEQALSKLTSDDLVIVTGGGRDNDLDRDGAQTIDQALESVGVLTDNASAQTLNTGNWSVIGIPGLPRRSAHQLVGAQQGAGAQPGSMSGALQLDSKGNFTFTWPPEHSTFDSHAPGSTNTQNIISVNGKQYPSARLNPGQSGVQVLWLDADTLDVRGNFTYLNQTFNQTGNKIECVPPGPGPRCLWYFVSYRDGKLGEISADPHAMLIVTTIHQPDVLVSQTTWAAFAQQLLPFGVNPQLMLPLPGHYGHSPGDYSLVGLNGIGKLGPNRGAQVSTAFDGVKAARLVGTFKRNRQGLLQAAGAASPDPELDAAPFQPDLQRLLAQPPEPFPAFDTPAEKAAQRYIAGRLGLRLDPRFGIRANYWQDPSIDWITEADDLDDLGPCTGHPCDVAFAGVRDQLRSEFPKVATVMSYFTTATSASLQGVLTDALLSAGIDFYGISNEIMAEYDDPGGTAYGDGALDIVEGTMILGEVAGEFTEPEFAPIFGIAVAALVTAQGTTNHPSGVPIWDPIVFQQEIGNFAHALNGVINAGLTGLDQVAALLVGDWGRLQAAVKRINASSGENAWGMSEQRSSALRKTLTLSLRRYMWSSLLPVPVIVADAPNHTQSPCCTGPPPRVYDWLALPEPPNGGGALDPRVMYLCKRNTGLTYPDSQILDGLFNSPGAQPPGVGFTQPYLYGFVATGSSSPGFDRIYITDQSNSDNRWCSN